MRIDHFVIHVDNDSKILESLKKTAASAGFPLIPDKGKSSQGFKITNIFMGKEYFEILRITDENNTNWEPHWLKRYKKGKRGIFCLFLEVENLKKIYEDFKLRSFTDIKIIQNPYTPYWEIIYLPVIPGTDMEIGFIEYQFPSEDKCNIEKYFQPNSTINGITGIVNAKIEVPHLAEKTDYFKKVFSQLEEKRPKEFSLNLQNGNIIFRESSTAYLKVYLESFTKNPKFIGKKFTLENVEVKNISDSIL